MHEAYEIIRGDRTGRIVVHCDHASNHVPGWVNGGSLGIAAADMNRHIAYDVGASGVSRHLAEIFAAPAILSRFSRLVIDPNRGEDDPTLVMRLYDGTIIAANRRIDDDEVEHRLSALYRPYHDALGRLVAARPDPILVSVHSFTPRLNGHRPRPWQVGVLYAGDDRIARPLLERLGKEADLRVGDNEPYSGHLVGDTMDRHALGPGHPHVLIELRNDLIADEDGQRTWARRLAPAITDAIAAAGV